MFLGAELAIEQFNASGGFDGVPLRLVQRWGDDPWRGGSKEMIKLVYEDSVWAVIGSVDGAATHVAEQVVTKAWLPLLSPVSADPTLTYIRIPWMFRLPPDDEEQAAVLLRDGIVAKSLSNVGLITSTDHDGRIFGEEMREQMSAAQVSPAFHLQVSPPNLELGETARRVSSFGPDAVVVRLPVDEVLALFDSFESNGLNVPVLIPWVPGLQPADLNGRYCGQVMYVLPFSDIENQAFAVFSRDYWERYGESPTPSAAYTFDAVNLLVQSFTKDGDGAEDGLNRARLRDALAGSSGYVGVTGPFSWDNAGGNRTEPVIRILDGRGSSN
jgi:ABC-type branched-subunit amino acid transport system substrate-binding protein